MLKEEPKVISEPSAKYQYLATIVVNLLLLGYGVSSGWPSPNIILLTSDNSPLPSGKISMEEASWVASILCIGGLIGNIFFGFITNAFGRRLPLILLMIATIAGWVLILLAKNVYYLYIARFLNGFIAGGVLSIVPLYLNEIANDRYCVYPGVYPGRRLPLILLMIPTIAGWVLILLAQNVYYLYIARFLNGFIAGGILSIVPLYLNEIANDGYCV